jgi:hypothetical protein
MDLGMTGLGPVVLGLAVLTTPPVLDDGPAEPPRQRLPLPDTRLPPEQVKKAVAEVVRIVTAFDRLPEISRNDIERVLGVRLSRPPDKNAGPFDYEAALPSGPFSRVNFRHSDPAAKERFSILAFDVRPEMPLRRKDFDQGFIGPHTVTVEEARGLVHIHSHDRPGRTTMSLFLVGGEVFQGVGIHRGRAAKIKPP